MHQAPRGGAHAALWSVEQAIPGQGRCLPEGWRRRAPGGPQAKTGAADVPLPTPAARGRLQLIWVPRT